MKQQVGYTRVPSLAQRRLELLALGLPGARLDIRRGRELIYWFNVSPSEFGRTYRCRLRVTPDAQTPEVLVVSPDLRKLAAGDTVPHIYPHVGPETKLCLWWPKQREWVPQLSLSDTFISWTTQWLWYFEDWLFTREWAGGGAPHPQARTPLMKRFAKPLRKSEQQKGSSHD